MENEQSEFNFERYDLFKHVASILEGAGADAITN